MQRGKGTKVPESHYYLVMAAVMLMLMLAFCILGIVSREDWEANASMCATSSDCVCFLGPDGRICMDNANDLFLAYPMPFHPRDYTGAIP